MHPSLHMSSTPAPAAPTVPDKAPSAPATPGSYTVVAGDTLSGIAASHQTIWRVLFALNTDRVADPDRIFVDQQLRLP